MLLSAEVRWFWKGIPPAAFLDWFGDAMHHPFRAGGKSRVDHYVRGADQIEFGIKARGVDAGASPGDGLEMKGLVAVRSLRLAFSNLSPCAAEVWCKWKCMSVSPRSQPGVAHVAVSKQRLLRKFSVAGSVACEIELGDAEQTLQPGPLPDEGCNVELTRIALLAGTPWWTLGFEAFGSLDRIEANLQTAIETMQSRQPPTIPSTPTAFAASYPKWLSQLEFGVC